ncbi:MAG: zf-TFIIB domain-containing protein [Bdellovibrionota bacterium]
MNCPECGSELHSQNVGGVTLDECAGCGGTWFDRDELRSSKDLADSDLNWVDFDLWSDAKKFVHVPGNRLCPHCGTPMSVVSYADTHVHIECCESCHGVWMGRGKFAQLVDTLEKEVNSKSLGEYFSAALEEAKELVTGKESFSAEWRDFVTVFRLLEYRLLANHPKLHDTLTLAQKTNPLK